MTFRWSQTVDPTVRRDTPYIDWNENEGIYHRLDSVVDLAGRQVTYRYHPAIPIPVEFIPVLQEVLLPEGRTLFYDYQVEENPDAYGCSGACGFPSASFYSWALASARESRHVRIDLIGVRLNGRPQAKTAPSNLGAFQEMTSNGLTRTTYERTNDPETNLPLVKMETTPTTPAPGAGRLWSFGLDNRERVHTLKDPHDGLEEYEYDSLSNIQTYTNALNEKARLFHDNRSNVIRAIDARNLVTKFDWTDDNLVNVTDADGGLIKIHYDSKSNVDEVTDPANHTRKFTYTTFGKVQTVTDALNHTWTYGHDANGFVNLRRSPPGPNQSTWTFVNDQLGRRVSATEPGNITTMFWFDQRSRLTNVTLPAVQSQFLQQALPAVNTSTVWTPDDLVNTTTDAAGRVTSYSYDVNLRLKSVTEPGTPPMVLDYDSFSNVVNLTNPNQITTTFAFDKLNRLTNITYPGPAGQEAFEYDKDSNLKKWTKSDGKKVTYDYNENSDLKKLSSGTFTLEMGYDSLNRVDDLKQSDDGQVETTHYGYQPNYLLGSVTSSREEVAYQYDQADRLINRNVGIHQPGTPLGSFTYGAELETIFSYNERDEMISATQDSQRVEYAYSLAGDLTQTTLPNGIVGRNSFNARHQAIKLEYQKGGDAPLYSLTYDHNQLGQRRRYHHMAPDRNDMTVYGYNLRDELTNCNTTRAGTAQTRTFNYDNNHNRTQLVVQNTGADFTTTYGINSADQMMTGHNLTWGYSDAGARDRQTGPPSYTANFDILDRMVSYTSSTANATYKYDGSSRRVEKTVRTSSSNVTTGYLWDGGELLTELYGPGAPPAPPPDPGPIPRPLPSPPPPEGGPPRISYLLGAGREGMKAISEDQWFWYLTDAQGSVLAVTDQLGDVRQRVEYPDPYGDPKILANTLPATLNVGTDNRFFFTGEMHDPESGLVYLHNRYYDPSHGRFVSRDPIGYKGGLNLYAYCENDPINHSDPSGLEAQIKHSSTVTPLKDGRLRVQTAIKNTGTVTVYRVHTKLRMYGKLPAVRATGADSPTISGAGQNRYGGQWKQYKYGRYGPDTYNPTLAPGQSTVVTVDVPKNEYMNVPMQYSTGGARYTELQVNVDAGFAPPPDYTPPANKPDNLGRTSWTKRYKLDDSGGITIINENPQQPPSPMVPGSRPPSNN